VITIQSRVRENVTDAVEIEVDVVAETSNPQYCAATIANLILNHDFSHKRPQS